EARACGAILQAARVTGLAVGLALVLVLLSALHVYWAAGGTWGKGATIPERQGRPAFRPEPLGTMAAAALLAAAALVVLGRDGLGPAAALGLVTRVGSWAVAAAFLLRGVGDFRLVGLFRRADDTRFARWDRRVYTPLALALGLGTAVLAAGPA
ncbi:MAG: DUF3995 domain-containing protein, partial [Gemmatimonadales bacterium]